MLFNQGKAVNSIVSKKSRNYMHMYMNLASRGRALLSNV